MKFCKIKEKISHKMQWPKGKPVCSLTYEDICGMSSFTCENSKTDNKTHSFL